MGYILSNVMQAPFDNETEFYVWLIGMGWDDGLESVVRQNFHKLASRFGPEGAFIIPTETASEHWGERITRAYFPMPAGSYDSKHDPKLFAPCLFIADAPPHRVRSDTLRAFVPLAHVHANFGSFDALFNDLVRLVRDRDVALFNKMEERMHWMTDHHDVLELKPNLFGFGLNINAVIEKIRKHRARRT